MIDILSISIFSVFLEHRYLIYFAGWCGHGKFRIDSDRDANLTFLASRENQLALNCGFGLLGVVIWYVCGVSTLFYFSWFVHYHEVPGKCIFFQWTPGATFGVLALTILVSWVSQFLSAFFFSCVVVAVILRRRASATRVERVLLGTLRLCFFSQC